jgi:carboxylate-amine ligase
MSWDFKFGIEEEYFVNDATKRDVAKSRIREFFASCRAQLSDDIQPEMLEPQIEIATKPMVDFAEARSQLSGLRSSVGTIARDYNLSIMASGTHPLAIWSRVRANNAQPRYGKVMHDLQMLGSRTILCGMHVHVEVPDLAARVDIMNRIQPYLPLLLALSTSSPFWHSARDFWAIDWLPIASCRAPGCRICSRMPRITSAISIPWWPPAPSRTRATYGG